MTCPNCGAAVQPHDLFCMSCGHALGPADPTRRLGDPAESPYATAGAPTVEAAPSPQPSQPSPSASPPYGRPTYGAPPLEERDDDGPRWASGSSFPDRNPYANTPTTFSPGTILNGRPVGRRRRGGNGVLSSLGAAVVAILLVLKAIGGHLAAGGLGIFKIIWLASLFNWLGAGHSWVAILIVVLIISAIWRSRIR